MQANFPEVSDSELKGMDGKIAELQKKVELGQAECKQLESRKTLILIQTSPSVLCVKGGISI